jgi:hypothetical protein
MNQGEASMHGFEDRGIAVPKGRFAESGRFGRMFPELRSLKEIASEDAAKTGVQFLAGKMVAPGGPPDPTKNNPRIKSGYTFLGQFIDHDLTLDATSILEQQIDLNATVNFRTPAFELDSIYGRGPDASPVYYDPANPGMFVVERNGTDLPRLSNGRAVLGDPRNDENRIIGQLHVLFLKFHNAVLTAVRNEAGFSGKSARVQFEEAQRRVRWHYQWIVLNEFLVRMVGRQMVDDVLAATPRNVLQPDYMPVEFSGAAYRSGHSQIRGAYQLQTGGGFVPIFGAAGADLRGGAPLPDGVGSATPNLVIDWSRFFGADAQPGMKLDTQLAGPLFTLPPNVAPPNANSLAERNLQRGMDLGLPAGETIANRLGLPALTPAELWTGVYADPAASTQLAPLWYYVLKEAEIWHDGHRLGPVGGHIVTQTFVNLLLADKASYLWQFRHWTPELPSEVAGTFTVTDLVKFTLGGAAPAITGEDVDALPDVDTVPDIPVVSPELLAAVVANGGPPASPTPATH